MRVLVEDALVSPSRVDLFKSVWLQYKNGPIPFIASEQVDRADQEVSI